MISINDEAVPADELHHYAIRFCRAGDEAVPVLYFQGKRVTQSWRIELVAEVPEDEFGGNANTA